MKAKTVPTQGAGPENNMLATIHMLNGIVYTLPYISATFRTNFWIVDVIQAKILGENLILTIFFFPEGSPRRKTERNSLCRGKF